LLAARRLGLRPVLWSVDGQDWAASATPSSIASRVVTRLEPGAVVLLHDSDITSAAGSWQRMLGALPDIVGHCRERGWPIGPLSEHALAGAGAHP
jgi:peptidoglycan/xylan/chitin deacetylase (PgdA/CDA1 family)